MQTCDTPFFYKADVRGAAFNCANLDDATGFAKAENPRQQKYDILVFPNPDNTPQVVSGCRNFTVAQAFAHCKAKLSPAQRKWHRDIDLPRLVGALATFVQARRLMNNSRPVNVSLVFGGVSEGARNQAICRAMSKEGPLSWQARADVKKVFGELLPR